MSQIRGVAAIIADWTERARIAKELAPNEDWIYTVEMRELAAVMAHVDALASREKVLPPTPEQIAVWERLASLIGSDHYMRRDIAEASRALEVLISEVKRLKAGERTQAVVMEAIEATVRVCSRQAELPRGLWVVDYARILADALAAHPDATGGER